MSVLMLVAGLDVGGAHGGAERAGLELAAWLCSTGQPVEVCAFWRRSTPAETFWQARLAEQGVPVWYAADWRGWGHLPAYLRGLAAVLRRAPPGGWSVVHSHFQLGSVAAVLLRLSGRARWAIRTAHVTLEWGPGCFNGLCRAVFTGWIFPLLLDGEAGVSQAVVEGLRRRTAARMSCRPPVLIYNCLPAGTPVLEPVLRRGALIGSVGRLTAQKDTASLLRAFALLLRQFPAARLLLVGEGEERPALESLARAMGLGERVQFAGQQAQVTPLLAEMSLFVLPSRWEGLPTAVLEAQAAGLAVIASDLPGTRELVENGATGWLFPPGDMQKLAEAVTDALLHPQEARRRAVEAQRRLERFSLPAAGAAYLALYRGEARRI